eukprot:7242-Heterococcus_DN1.PRE.1
MNKLTHIHVVARAVYLFSDCVTDVFFGVTKLFQSKDHNLRRMMYLFIKEVAEATNPDDVIIVTSSLTKDMNCSEDLYRANSIRVLARIIDSNMLGAIERYIKQAINDKNAIVSSSALVSGLAFFNTSPDVVKRWNNEHDRLAVTKLVAQLTKGSTRSPLAVCLLI